MSFFTQNPTAFYLKLSTGYYDELIGSGRRDMAAAFVEYCRDVDRGRIFKFQDYAKYWFNDYAKKSKAFQWITKFNVAIEAFKKASEKTFVKNPVAPKLNQDTTVSEPDLNGSDTSNADNNELLENQVEPILDEVCTEIEPDLNISIISKTNKSIIKKEEKEKLTLPDWLPPEHWKRWVGYRRETNLSVNIFTLRIQLEKLEKLFHAGHDPVELIDCAIDGVWRTFYEPRQTSSKSLVVGGTSQSVSWDQEKRHVRSNGEAIIAAFQAEGHNNILDYLEKRNQEEGAA
jgi:hypothetical protein